MKKFDLKSFDEEKVSLDQSFTGGEVTPTGEPIGPNTYKLTDYYDSSTGRTLIIV